MKNEFVFGNSSNFKKTMEEVSKFAKSPWPVLLTGETGVGKELIAQRIHALSLSAKGPFVPVNCAALPAGLFESELFGFERGAFSGAIQSHRGLVRTAQGGTLFLDEIGEVDLSAQVKLLRLLESNEVRPVGSSRCETVQVRIVAATNQNLTDLVRQGKFRLDLLERLSVLPIAVPALRDRKEDIPLIGEAILNRLGSAFSPETLHRLKEFQWPGNVRQLKNLLIRAHVLGHARVDDKLLESLLREERTKLESVCLADPIPAGVTLAEIEKQVVMERLKRVHGNRKQAAKELGIAKSTLHEKIKKWKEEGTGQAWPLYRNPEPASATLAL